MLPHMKPACIVHLLAYESNSAYRAHRVGWLGVVWLDCGRTKFLLSGSSAVVSGCHDIDRLLVKCSANCAPLSVVSFVLWSHGAQNTAALHHLLF